MEGNFILINKLLNLGVKTVADVSFVIKGLRAELRGLKGPFQVVIDYLLVGLSSELGTIPIVDEDL